MKFERVKRKIDRGLSFVIYADPGVGKTTLSGTLPVGETLIIMCEAGYGPLVGSDHIVFALKEDLSQLEALYKTLRTQKQFKYIVIDNISEMEQWMLHVLTTSRKKDFVELKEYGDCSYKLREYIRLFRDLIYDGKTVIFNAWEVPLDIQIKSGEVQTKAFPKLSKKLAIELCGLVDVVGHLEIYPKTGDRYLRFEPTSGIIAKSQWKGLEKFEPANFPDILHKLYSYEYETKDGDDNGRKKV